MDRLAVNRWPSLREIRIDEIVPPRHTSLLTILADTRDRVCYAQQHRNYVSRFTELDVSTRIDTSTGAARPELVVEISPRLTARVTRALGEPAAGQSPDRTFLKLELRVRQNWALSTTVGDRGGTALEVVWRTRF
jgi:hypothetical protein